MRPPSGLHLFEDQVITEVVDENNRPVPPGRWGAKVLVTVLFARTLPLIRYEMTDSIRLSTDHDCPCGRPYALLDGIQGREQEALHFPTSAGPTRVVQPVVFHHVMDQVTAAGWQIVQQPDGLDVLLAGSRGVEPSVLAARLQTALAEQGVTVPEIRIEEVPAIPRTALGKAPLITTAVTRSMGPQSAHEEPGMSG
jgi:phenylacetate-CoA ligase